ncbi:DUF3850 domain-containing protein [Lactococcus garvieae]|uniref:DUF3850 domain-containing protein n=1 Tax=Lactococcus garvieae TaxID=1363 RepID=UPI0030D237B4
MKIHELKLDIKYFEDVKSGKKNFEIRKNDRDFQIGDVLELKAYKNYKNGKKSHYIRHENDSVLKTYNPDRADTINVKVISITTAKTWNEPLSFIPANIENKVNDIITVMHDYFGVSQLPDDYVVLGIEVVK